MSRLADGRTMRLRTTILATLALAFSLTACGRSDALEGDPAGIYEVRSARDVTLDDGEIVFVEVTEPASPEVTAEVMGLHDGCTMDDLLDAISPDGDEKLHFFGDVAVHVKVEGDLRAVIWF